MDFPINGINDTPEAKLTKANAEQKRMQSIIERKKSYRKQKDAIKTALSSVDTSNNKRIVFDFEDNATYQIENTEKKSLFDKSDDDNDNVEYNFEMKNCFKGKKGEKLMELQSKFKSDKRFIMDERFLENDENEIIESDALENTEDDCKEITKEEKQKEMSILEDILGQNIYKSSEKHSHNKKSLRMLRYDPSNPEHSKYILNKNEESSAKKKRKKKEQPEINEKTEEREKPSVSKETFYEVKENLKETLEQNNTFSFLNNFGSNETSEGKDKESDDIVEANSMENGNVHRNSARNPFRYDSSEESDNEEHFKNVEEEDTSKTADQNISKNASTVPSRLWTEPFFFREDDYRLQEGADFVQKFELDDGSEFKQVRRNIKEIVRIKVRNNKQKNKLFRKKLGGRKMVRMKKALKNK